MTVTCYLGSNLTFISILYSYSFPNQLPNHFFSGIVKFSMLITSGMIGQVNERLGARQFGDIMGYLTLWGQLSNTAGQSLTLT